MPGDRTPSGSGRAPRSRCPSSTERTHGPPGTPRRPGRTRPGTPPGPPSGPTPARMAHRRGPATVPRRPRTPSPWHHSEGVTLHLMAEPNGPRLSRGIRPARSQARCRPGTCAHARCVVRPLVVLQPGRAVGELDQLTLELQRGGLGQLEVED